MIAHCNRAFHWRISKSFVFVSKYLFCAAYLILIFGPKGAYLLTNLGNNVQMPYHNDASHSLTKGTEDNILSTGI